MDLIKKLIIVVALTFFNVCTCFAQEPSVNEIINNVHKAYGEAQTYSDSGEVKTVFVRGGGKGTDIKTFTTAFVRPDRFRLELKFKLKPDDPDWIRYIVWQNGDKIMSWNSRANKSKSLESLAMAIAGPAGLSGGSASYIPSLLRPYEVRGRRITDLQEIKIIESKDGVIQINGARSVDIKGLDKFFDDLNLSTLFNDDVTLWIDSKSFLIKRIDIHTTSSDFESTTSIMYTPEINVVIDDKKLEFQHE